MTKMRPMVGLFIALAMALVGLLASPAQADYEPGEPGYSFQLKVGVKPAKKIAWGSAEQTDEFNQIALQYRPTKADKWKIVASKQGDPNTVVDKVTKTNAAKGFYRTRVSTSGIDCSQEPCTTKTFYYFSSVVRMK